MPYSAKILEKLKIDDAVGAVTAHGVVGAWGVIAVGIFAVGYPALSGDVGVATTSFLGQFVGLIVMALCGFVPGYLISLVMKAMGKLRVPENVEIAGLDITEVPLVAYPENVFKSSASAAE